MSTPPIRLLLIDDHPLVRDGLRARLATVPGFEVVGEAGSAAEAQQQVLLHQPTLVLMDVGMRDMNGIDLTALLLGQHPALQVLMLSMYDNPEYVQRARAQPRRVAAQRCRRVSSSTQRGPPRWLRQPSTRAGRRTR